MLTGLPGTVRGADFALPRLNRRRASRSTPRGLFDVEWPSSRIIGCSDGSDRRDLGQSGGSCVATAFLGGC